MPCLEVEGVGAWRTDSVRHAMEVYGSEEGGKARKWNSWESCCAAKEKQNNAMLWRRTELMGQAQE